MVTTDTLIWIILGTTGTVCVVSMLGVFASIMRHESHLHDLRNRVAELQFRYTVQLARLHGHVGTDDSDSDGVDILDDSGRVMSPVAMATSEMQDAAKKAA